METYCVIRTKYTVNENSNIKKIEQNRLMLLSNCAICSKKNIKFCKNLVKNFCKKLV